MNTKSLLAAPAMIAATAVAAAGIGSAVVASTSAAPATGSGHQVM